MTDKIDATEILEAALADVEEKKRLAKAIELLVEAKAQIEKQKARADLLSELLFASEQKLNHVRSILRRAHTLSFWRRSFFALVRELEDAVYVVAEED